MSLKNSEMHLYAGFGSPLVTLAVVGLLMLTERSGCSLGSGGDDDRKEDDSILIEAQLAALPSTQPNKPIPPPKPTEDTVAVSNDAKQKPVEKKKDEKKPDEKKHDITDFHHPTDDDNGPPTKPAQVGDLSGAINGDSAVSKGDPYFGRLKADMAFAPPEIAQGNGVPVGCILLQADGTIKDVRMKVETHDDLQTAAEAAIARLKKIRNDHPEPVPSQLLKFAGQYICFHFTVTQ